MSHPPYNSHEQPPPGPAYGYPGPLPPPPEGPPPRRPLSPGQRVGLSGCGILVAGFVVLVVAGMAWGPETVTKVKEKPVPGPTVTVTAAAAPAVTVTASPPLLPPGIPQLTGGTWKDALTRTVKLEARSAYVDVQLPADPAAWKVCGQEGAPVDGAAAAVVLHLAETTCPAKIGDRLTPEPAPTPPPAQAPDDKPATNDSTGGSATGGSGSTGGASSSGGSSGSGGTTGGSTGGSSSRVVHPGSFCSPAGAAGVTEAGTPMVCGPGSDGRNRWKRS
ncbi:hypothetical protein [Streptomyces sp. NPDC058401]|uniref:hypothetical protein n=1 Tax=Streptomyces sp. NPDC058401 TaxID=3346480 RepID=UPI0036573D8D